MNQGAYVTLVGYVAREPSLRQTDQGVFVADMRVGTASRYFDKKAGEWQDGDASYFTVTCWRRLAENAKASLHKGEPIIVRGKFRTRSYTDKAGVQRTEVEVTADAFGHDLTRGVANFIKSGRGLDAPGGRRDEDAEGQDRAGGVPPEDDQGGDDGMMASDRLPYDGPPAGAAASASAGEASGEPGGGDDPMVHRIVNDAAVAQFSERLADDGAVARELAEESREQAASEDAVPF